MKKTRQGVRDLSTMGPRNPERNRRVEEIPRQAPMAPDTWFHDWTTAMGGPRWTKGYQYAGPTERSRPIFGDPDLGEE